MSLKPDAVDVCPCAPAVAPRARLPGATARSAPALVLGVLLAFFPKCPMCWAAYMSVFGSVGLARAPYMAWLFPVLLALSGLNLWLMLKRVPHKGHGPVLLSLAGTVVVLGGRSLLPTEPWLLPLGMGLMVLGSLLNGFSPSPSRMSVHGLTRKEGPS